MKVCKFGGSSLADGERVKQVCDIVLGDPERRVVVVSAPGKRFSGDTKVTDLLMACAGASLGGASAKDELKAVSDRFEAICDCLGLPVEVMESICGDLEARLKITRRSDAHFMDAMKAAGEANSGRMVAAELARRGVKARYLDPQDAGMLLSDEYGNAAVLDETYANLASIAEYDGITVFPGFFGYTRNGDLVTFPRGGSDITGSILAVAVGAEVYENFTDVDSVYAADPRIIECARRISRITFREMRELSYAGFAVLHDEAVIPAVRAGIPICIKNTANPDGEGTMVLSRREHESGRAVGIAGAGGFCTVFVEKYLMNREIGFGRRLLQIFEEEGLSYEHAPSGIDNMSIILRENQFTAEMESHVVQRIRSEMSADDVEVEHGLGIVMVVGEGLRYALGMSAKAAGALAGAGINIEMINQGASEISMMFGVKGEDCDSAVRSLYKAFFEDPERSA